MIPGQDPNIVRHSPDIDRPFGLAFDPAAFLEPSMLTDIEDHMQSLFASFGPRADVVILRDATVNETDPEQMTPCPLGSGRLPRVRIRELLALHVPESTPIMVQGAALNGSLEWLGRSA